MDELIYIRIDEIAQSATVPQIKYWCKLLKIKPKIISRASHVTNEEAEVLKKISTLVSNGMRPQEAVKLTSNELMITSSVSPKPVINKEIAELKDVIMLLVEQNKKLENKIDNQNVFINKQAKDLQIIKQALFPTNTAKKIEVWKPERKKTPEYPYLKRIWYSFVNPERLRAY